AFSSREPVPTSLENALERCSAAKLELLHPVKRTLGQRDRIIEAQRTERRGPDQADAYGRADGVAAVVLQSQAGTRRWSRIRRWANTAGRVDFAGCGPGSRPLVVVQTACVG